MEPRFSAVRLDEGERWRRRRWCPGLERPDQREGRCPRVFGEAYPVSCPRYRCPVHRARTAAGGRDAGEGVDRRPGVDVYREPVHADAEVRIPVVRRGPPVPDRVLTSRFTGFRWSSPCSSRRANRLWWRSRLRRRSRRSAAEHRATRPT